jgi:hypothetical protein
MDDFNDARRAANRIALAWQLAQLRKYAKMRFEQERANNGALILQSCYRLHLARMMLLNQRHMHAKALYDFSILARDLGSNPDSYTPNRRVLAEKLIQVLTCCRIESASFRSHRAVIELKRSTGLGTLSAMLQLLCELGRVHAVVAGCTMGDEQRAICARCIGVVVCVVSSSFAAASPSRPAVSPFARASKEAQLACFSPHVVADVVFALTELLHSAVHSSIACARGVVAAIHQILGKPSAAPFFCTASCCKLLLEVIDQCNDASSCTSIAASIRILMKCAEHSVKVFAANAMSGDRLALLLMAANCAASQAAVLDLSIELLDVTPAPFQQSAVQACIVSSVHSRLATDSVRLKFAPLCMKILPLLHSENPALSRAPDAIMALLSTTTLSQASETKTLLLADITTILNERPGLKEYFSNTVAVEMFCDILRSSARSDAVATAASRAMSCIAYDCAVAQEAFDSCDVFSALFSIVSQSASPSTHAEVCRVMVALLRGRGSASRAWCDVNALSDGICAICNVADSHSCEAAAELLDALAVEMDPSVAEALHARGGLPGAVERIAAAAPSHWCRVLLLSAVYRFILLSAAFRSSLCSQALVKAAQAAMMSAQDDYECGTVANAVGELVRGHAVNKAAFSCEATCMGLKRMAEAAAEQVTVRECLFVDVRTPIYNVMVQN